MFNENLKALRKKKGFTQEELAIRVNVVRQTISKWEKGLSVPDADTLQKIAEILDVEVSELLGAKLMKDAHNNEVAEQLARINEQLAIKNRRWSRFWKVVGIILIVGLILNILGVTLYGVNKHSHVSEDIIEETMIDEEFEDEE